MDFLEQESTKSQRVWIFMNIISRVNQASYDFSNDQKKKAGFFRKNLQGPKTQESFFRNIFSWTKNSSMDSMDKQSKKQVQEHFTKDEKIKIDFDIKKMQA